MRGLLTGGWQEQTFWSLPTWRASPKLCLLSPCEPCLWRLRHRGDSDKQSFDTRRRPSRAMRGYDLRCSARLGLAGLGLARLCNAILCCARLCYFAILLSYDMILFYAMLCYAIPTALSVSSLSYWDSYCTQCISPTALSVSSNGMTRLERLRVL